MKTSEYLLYKYDLWKMSEYFIPIHLHISGMRLRKQPEMNHRRIISTHSTFKTLLFIYKSAGIHVINNSQDICFPCKHDVKLYSYIERNTF